MHEMKEFLINGKNYGYLNPYLIAEIGVNHEGNMDRAKRMIRAIAKAGGHAAKFQSYKADLLAAKGSSPAYWDQTKEVAKSQHELFQRWDAFSEEDFRELARECENCGIDFISTPFDLNAVDFVAALAPAIKVASADITNIPLLRKIATKRKPVIMSTGASRFDEIAIARDELKRFGSTDLALLHCVLNYPTDPADAQLAQIPALMRIFGHDCPIGYSDHVKPNDDGAMPVLEMAIIQGSVIIEKHFTDDKNAVGNDHYHAMDESDLAAFVSRIDRIRDFYGSQTRDISGEALAVMNARRRIVAARDIPSGAVLEADDLIALRSNHGVEIAHWDRFIGQTVTRDIAKGAPLNWKDI